MQVPEQNYQVVCNNDGKVNFDITVNTLATLVTGVHRRSWHYCTEIRPESARYKSTYANHSKFSVHSLLCTFVLCGTVCDEQLRYLL